MSTASGRIRVPMKQGSRTRFRKDILCIDASSYVLLQIDKMKQTVIEMTSILSSYNMGY